MSPIEDWTFITFPFIIFYKVMHYVPTTKFHPKKRSRSSISFFQYKRVKTRVINLFLNLFEIWWLSFYLKSVLSLQFPVRGLRWVDLLSVSNTFFLSDLHLRMLMNQAKSQSLICEKVWELKIGTLFSKNVLCRLPAATARSKQDMEV